MRLLSDLPQYDETVFGFVKFSEKKYLEPLQKGALYMNNLKYFIELEKKTGIKGMGDSFEGGHIMSEIKLEFRDPESDELLFEGTAKRSVLRLNSFLDIPIFCIAAIDSTMLEIVGEDEQYYHTRLHLSDQQKANFISEFGDHALMISRDQFIEQFTKAFNEQGLHYRGALVKYTDFNINNEERMKSFDEENPSFFFWKSDEIAYQKEYRIVILNKPSETATTINIGDMSDFSLLIPVQQMLSRNENEGLIITVRKL